VVAQVFAKRGWWLLRSSNLHKAHTTLNTKH
jgi:hypothetical protein